MQDFRMPGMLEGQESPMLSRKPVEPSDVIITVRNKNVLFLSKDSKGWLLYCRKHIEQTIVYIVTVKCRNSSDVM